MEKGNLIKAKSRNIKLIYGSEIACEKRKSERAREGKRKGRRERKVAPKMLQKNNKEGKAKSNQELQS